MCDATKLRSEGIVARWQRVLKEQKDERTGFRGQVVTTTLSFPVEKRRRKLLLTKRIIYRSSPKHI